MQDSTYREYKLQSSPCKGDILRMMLRQDIQHLSIIANTRREPSQPLENFFFLMGSLIARLCVLDESQYAINGIHWSLQYCLYVLAALQFGYYTGSRLLIGFFGDITIFSQLCDRFVLSFNQPLRVVFHIVMPKRGGRRCLAAGIHVGWHCSPTVRLRPSDRNFDQMIG